MPAKFVDLSGQLFGFLTVLKFYNFNSGGQTWMNIDISKEIAEFKQFGTVYGKLPSEFK